MSADKKSVSDPVHRTIELSSLELEIVSSPVFQRLRNVKQLGLAHLVYPGADYSRFSHSIGVCHVTGRILASLQERAGVDISPDEIQKYRLAALLHDVGHYPFSHAMERAIENYFSEKLYQPKRQGALDLPESNIGAELLKGLPHVDLSKEILKRDPVIPSILGKANLKPEDIYSIILRTRPERFSNLVSSDLDADRIDYLLRTAHFTGLHYGSIDIDYLVSQLRVDNNERLCITEKALRAADHLLIARYFDYQQVNYHKTVAAFELVLENAIEILLTEGMLECSAGSIRNMISDGSWQSFDDLHVMTLMRELYEKTTDENAKQKLGSLLTRYPAKLIVDYEYLGDREDKSHFKSNKRLVTEHLDKWSEQFKIPRELWYLWDRPGIKLTKVGSKYREDEEQDNIEQSVRVLSREGNNSKPIAQVPHSLMSVLANYALYSLRVYVLLRPDQEPLRQKIRKAIRADLHEIPWK